MFEFTRRGVQVFGLDLRWYGILIALGVLSAVLVALRREERLGLEKDTTLNLALLCVPVGIVCARIYYVIFSWENYAGSLKDIFNFRQGGLAIYGGVIGGVIAGCIYSAVKKVKIASLADLAAPSLALGQSIGRWGNFLNEEAFGREILNPSLHFFPMGVFADGAWHYAAFFYESLWCAMIVILLLIGEKKRVFRKTGDVALWYLFLYAAERSFVEGLRTDSLYLGPVRVSQLISVAAMLIIACVFALRGRKKILSWLPVLASLMLGISAALQSGILTAAFALLSVILAAALYITNSKKEKSTPA